MSAYEPLRTLASNGKLGGVERDKVRNASKLIRIWLVSPALILLAALTVRPIFLPGLVTLVGYLAFGVPIGHLITTALRRPIRNRAFSPVVVASTALFVGLASVTGMATTTFFNDQGVQQPNIALWALVEAGIAAALATAATMLADALLWLSNIRRAKVR
jgi:hypothetical protein